MSAATLAPHDALLPRSPGGNGAGALLALLVHAALVAALTVSVDWRSQPSDVVAAELWASVPQVAAPPPPPPPVATPAPQPAPTPPPAAQTRPAEADIAVEREQRRKALDDKKKRDDEQAERQRAEERRKADADKKKREQDQQQQQQRETAAQEKQLKEQREANLRRMMGDAATATAGSATQDAAPSAAYAGRVAALIRRASVFTGSVPGNPATEVEVRAAPSGSIIARRIVKTSGHKDWDDAVLQAIDKAGTLPRDTDGRVPAQIIVAFRPKDQ